MRYELTAYEIVGAFPNEVREYCPLKIRDLELQLIRKMANIRCIELSKHPEWVKNLSILMVESLYDQKISLMLDKYKKCMDIIKNYSKDSFIDVEEDIWLAKCKPIETLYNFEKIKKHGKRILAICPFHQEKSPSFVIYTKENKFHCFGCGCKGDSIDFFMKLNNVKFKQAVERMK